MWHFGFDGDWFREKRERERERETVGMSYCVLEVVKRWGRSRVGEKLFIGLIAPHGDLLIHYDMGIQLGIQEE
jgi:hypothetical protein